MENFTLGAGLASIAFWGFIAAVVVAGIWNDIRKKAEQQKTIRTIVESGQKLDQEILDSILRAEKTDPKQTSKDLKTAAFIVFGVGIGMIIFGLVIGFSEPKATMPLSGIGGLLLAIGGGLWAASEYIIKDIEE